MHMYIYLVGAGRIYTPFAVIERNWYFFAEIPMGATLIIIWRQSVKLEKYMRIAFSFEF